MIKDFLITRDDPEVQKLARKNYFDKVVTPKVTEESEKIGETMKKILGDDFYELKKLNGIEGIIQNECVFDMKYIKVNTLLMTYYTQSIVNLFQAFMGVIGNTVTDDGIKANPAKLCVSSTKDNYTEVEFTMNDLGEVAEYINGVPMTIKNYNAIRKLAEDIESTKQALQKAPDQESYNSLSQKYNEYQKQLSEYYLDIVTGFFNIVKKLTGVDIEDVNNKIVDISAVFDKTVTTDDGNQISIKSFVMMHSAYEVFYKSLEEIVG